MPLASDGTLGPHAGSNNGQPDVPAPSPTEGLPRSFTEAKTKFASWSRNRDTRVWLYYYAPVRDYVRRVLARSGALRNVEADADDLAHESMIRLFEEVLPHYDPARGPFRPYFKQAIRNEVRDQFRRRGVSGADMLDDLDALDAQQVAAERRRRQDVAEPTAADPEELALLVNWGRLVFADFVGKEEPRRQRAAQILSKRVVDGRSQEQLAEEFGLGERQVRNLLRSAVDRFAEYVDARVHPDDVANLVATVGRAAFPEEFHRLGMRGLFGHLSERKRTTVLALLFRLFPPDDSAGASPNA